MNVLEVSINVHRCPGEDVHTRAELVLEILEVRHEEGLGVGTDLVDDPVVFTEHKGKLVVVHLELLFLEKDNLGALRDLNTDTGKALGFTDQSHDLGVKVDVQFVVVGMSDDEGGEETSLGLLDLNEPSLSPFVLEVEERVSDSVVMSNLLDGLLGLAGSQEATRELLHGGGGSVEQMSGPGDGTRDNGQVSHDGRVSALLLVLLLDLLDETRVLVEEQLILAGQVALQVVAMEDAAELAEESEGVLDVDDV